VLGFRGPYLSNVNDNEADTAKAIDEAGYRYFTHFYWIKGLMPNNYIVHKPIVNGGYSSYTAYMEPEEMANLVNSQAFIVTLDHPWNIVYQDGDVITKDTSIPDNLRAVILTAISEGAQPRMLKDLRMY